VRDYNRCGAPMPIIPPADARPRANFKAQGIGLLPEPRSNMFFEADAPETVMARPLFADARETRPPRRADRLLVPCSARVFAELLSDICRASPSASREAGLILIPPFARIPARH